MDWTQCVVTIVCAILASSGFWGVIMKRMDQKEREKELRDEQARKDREAQRRLLIGLAHNEIIKQGMIYIERGYITKDEYENFMTYLYEPYVEYGGNGSGTKVANEVKHLPIKNYVKE